MGGEGRRGMRAGELVRRRGGGRGDAAALKRAVLLGTGLLGLALAGARLAGSWARARRADAEAAAALLGALAGGGAGAEGSGGCIGPLRSVVGVGREPLRVIAPLEAAGKFPLEAVLDELASVGDEAWLHKKLPYQDIDERGWSALGLRTVNGDTGPMAVYHGRYHPEVNQLFFYDTPSTALLPVAAGWMKAAATDGPERLLRGVRLLRLSGRQHLQPHWDTVVAMGGPQGDPVQFTQARYTVLLRGSQVMCFSSGRRGDEGPRGEGGDYGLADEAYGCYEMHAGVLYYVNIGVKHEVYVTSREDRVVLVADTEPTDSDIARICGAPAPPRSARPSGF